MATTQEIITKALRRVRVIGMLDNPPAEYSTHVLSALNGLLASWSAQGWATDNQSLSANYTNGSKVVTGLSATANRTDTSKLVVNMYVSGTGITSGTRIQSIDSSDQITLDTAATANGTAATLNFTILPLDDSLEQALVAVLAVRISEDFGAAVGPVLARDAKHGEDMLAGALMRVPYTSFDDTLIITPGSRIYSHSGVDKLT